MVNGKWKVPTQINASHVIARLQVSALTISVHRSNLLNIVHWQDLPLTKPYIAWLLALNGIQAKVRFCLGMPRLAMTQDSLTF